MSLVMHNVALVRSHYDTSYGQGANGTVIMTCYKVPLGQSHYDMLQSATGTESL